MFPFFPTSKVTWGQCPHSSIDIPDIPHSRRTTGSLCDPGKASSPPWLFFSSVRQRAPEPTPHRHSGHVDLWAIVDTCLLVGKVVFFSHTFLSSDLHSHPH